MAACTHGGGRARTRLGGMVPAPFCRKSLPSRNSNISKVPPYSCSGPGREGSLGSRVGSRHVGILQGAQGELWDNSVGQDWSQVGAGCDFQCAQVDQVGEVVLCSPNRGVSCPHTGLWGRPFGAEEKARCGPDAGILVRRVVTAAATWNGTAWPALPGVGTSGSPSLSRTCVPLPATRFPTSPFGTVGLSPSLYRPAGFTRMYSILFFF